MIVVMRVQAWNSLSLTANPHIEIDKASVPGTVGFLPVYPDRQSAEKDYPEGPFAEVQETEKEECDE